MKQTGLLFALAGVFLLTGLSLQGCALAAVGAAGAAGGYAASQAGYEVRSPVVDTEDSNSDQNAQEANTQRSGNASE